MTTSKTGRPAVAGRARPRRPRETVQTWTFDSAGDRKYAVQIQKAANGNPCLRLVEGVPQDDGTFRKFHLTIWSEDFARLFQTLDEARQFMKDKGIRTPPNHKWQPGKGPGKGQGRRQNGPAGRSG